MSKISKYKENIYTFLTTKSCFANAIDKDIIKDVIDSDYSFYLITLSTIFVSQAKKNKCKSYHIFHMTGAIFLMILTVIINENIKYYDDKYGDKNIKKILMQATIFIFDAVSQNMKTMENALDPDVFIKLQEKITTFFHEKMLLLTESTISDNKLKMKKTDITKFKFKDSCILDNKYKKLSRIENNDMRKYIEDKYGTIGQCVVVLGWIMGLGDSSKKYFDQMIKIGSSFGILVKLTSDFANLEDNIKNANGTSYNFIVNCGIHECFGFYDDNKVRFIEGCMLSDIFNNTIKEMVEYLEKKYDDCLKNTELELESQYSSYSSVKALTKKK